MTEVVDLVKLIATREDSYTIYVFKSEISDKLIMCTRLPNWQTSQIFIGEEGYLRYHIVKAGEDYYNPETGETIRYKYSNVYFNNFVRKTDNTKSEIFL